MTDAVDDVRGSTEIAVNDGMSGVVPWALDGSRVEHGVGELALAPEVTEHPRDVNQSRKGRAKGRHHHFADRGQLGRELASLVAASGCKRNGRTDGVRG